MNDRKYKLLFARFPFGGSEHPDSSNWMTKTVMEAKARPDVSEVLRMEVDDTPITMSRNRVLKACLDLGVDYVLMLDSDMRPDMPYPGAKPFFASALDFLVSREAPAAIAAPYCGPPPHENVYVFRWARRQSDHPNADVTLDQYTREEAAWREGIEEVAALPTGVFLLDMRALDQTAPPWFEYEWEDPPWNTKKATTEDVFFTRNLSLAGVPQFINWSSWAGHWKRKCVGKPSLLTSDCVRGQFREALARGRTKDERLVEVRPDGVEC